MAYIIIDKAIKALREIEPINFTVGSRADLYKFAWDAGRAVGLKEAQPKWISVEDRLPEPFVSVLVYMPEELPCPPVHEGYRTRDGRWYSAYFIRDLDQVTHWMPLPQPPKEEE